MVYVSGVCIVPSHDVNGAHNRYGTLVALVVVWILEWRSGICRQTACMTSMPKIETYIYIAYHFEWNHPVSLTPSGLPTHPSHPRLRPAARRPPASCHGWRHLDIQTQANPPKGYAQYLWDPRGRETNHPTTTAVDR